MKYQILAASFVCLNLFACNNKANSTVAGYGNSADAVSDDVKYGVSCGADQGNLAKFDEQCLAFANEPEFAFNGNRAKIDGFKKLFNYAGKQTISAEDCPSVHYKLVTNNASDFTETPSRTPIDARALGFSEGSDLTVLCAVKGVRPIKWLTGAQSPGSAAVSVSTQNRNTQSTISGSNTSTTNSDANSDVWVKFFAENFTSICYSVKLEGMIGKRTSTSDSTVDGYLHELSSDITKIEAMVNKVVKTAKNDNALTKDPNYAMNRTSDEQAAVCKAVEIYYRKRFSTGPEHTNSLLDFCSKGILTSADGCH